MHLYCPSSIYKNNRYTKKVYYIIVVGFVVAVFFVGLVFFYLFKKVLLFYNNFYAWAIDLMITWMLARRQHSTF